MIYSASAQHASTCASTVRKGVVVKQPNSGRLVSLARVVAGLVRPQM